MLVEYKMTRKMKKIIMTTENARKTLKTKCFINEKG